MENQKVRKLVLSALMAALVYVATSIIQIPSPVNGYVNLGDCFVLLSGWLLGPWYGAAAAASIPGNIVQGIAGIAIGLALAVLLQKAKAPALSGLEL